VSTYGFFHITQLAIAEIEKRHSGHVVQITTSLIEHANSHVPPCSRTDEGGLSAATNRCDEYAKLGIRVNAVRPVSSRRRCIPSKHNAQLPTFTPSRMGEISDSSARILYLDLRAS